VPNDDGPKLFTILHIIFNSLALVHVYPAIWAKAADVLNKTKQD
jgi:hypothetical protein